MYFVPYQDTMGTDKESDPVDCLPHQKAVSVFHSVTQCQEIIKKETESTLTPYCQNHYGQNSGKGSVRLLNKIVDGLQAGWTVDLVMKHKWV